MKMNWQSCIVTIAAMFITAGIVQNIIDERNK